MSDENLRFEDDEDLYNLASYEIPCRILAFRDDELIYRKTFMEFDETTADMEEKLRTTIARFIDDIEDMTAYHTRVTYDFFSVEYYTLQNWKLIYVYFMDDDDGRSKFLLETYKEMKSDDEEDKLSLLFKQRIANNPDGIDQMVNEIFTINDKDIESMISGYRLLFGSK